MHDGKYIVRKLSNIAYFPVSDPDKSVCPSPSTQRLRGPERASDALKGLRSALEGARGPQKASGSLGGPQGFSNGPRDSSRDVFFYSVVYFLRYILFALSLRARALEVLFLLILKRNNHLDLKKYCLLFDVLNHNL